MQSLGKPTKPGHWVAAALGVGLTFGPSIRTKFVPSGLPVTAWSVAPSPTNPAGAAGATLGSQVRNGPKRPVMAAPQSHTPPALCAVTLVPHGPSPPMSCVPTFFAMAPLPSVLYSSTPNGWVTV